MIVVVRRIPGSPRSRSLVDAQVVGEMVGLPIRVQAVSVGGEQEIPFQRRVVGDEDTIALSLCSEHGLSERDIGCPERVAVVNEEARKTQLSLH